MDNETLNKIKADLDSLKGHLQQERDELKLKLSLAKAEAKDEWLEIEEKWNKFSNTMNQVTKESSEQVSNAAKDLASELKAGYERIRKSLS